MRSRSPLLAMAVLLALWGCAGGDAQPEAAGGAAVGADTADASDCLRGAPEPFFSPVSELRPLPSGEAMETVATPGAIALVLRHYGCAHFAVDFDFTWQGAMPEPPTALGEAAALLESLPASEGYEAVLRSVAAAMRDMATDPSAQPLALSDATLSVELLDGGTLRLTYDVPL